MLGSLGSAAGERRSGIPGESGSFDQGAAGGGGGHGTEDWVRFVAVATGVAEVAGVLDARRVEYGGRWFAERFVTGRELNVALLAGEDGVRTLPVAEIRFEGFPAQAWDLLAPGWAGAGGGDALPALRQVIVLPTGEVPLRAGLMTVADLDHPVTGTLPPVVT